MNKQRQIEHLESLTAKMAETMLSKGDDYSGEDRLSNFKLVAQICKLTVEQVLMVFMATKVVRLGNLQGKLPNNESVEDNTIDLMNYGALSCMARSEK